MTQASAIQVAHEAQEDIPCPLCGEHSPKLVLYARDRLFARPGTYSIVSCSNCELRYLSPRPTLEALGAHYPAQYFIYQPAEDLPAFSRPMARFFAEARWRESITRLERVRGKLEPDARVVDVGCGLNDYLVTLKKMRGIQGIGVDFSPEAAAYVRDRLQMPVHAGTLQQANFKDGSFDVVSMNEYLEHEPNPREVLREARRITAKGGHLCLEIPHPDGLPARVFGARWSQIDAPRHLLHFSEKTLREMLRRSGFELIHTETFSIPYVIGFSVLQALGHRNLGRLTAWDRTLAILVALPFILLAPWIDEFRFAVARAV
ncbi:MAG TPA: class I SAM-dependent methyltransferase [Polyangiales bacterium]|nr:class I SAM-dependent methyltransferase [Polyangiales bacterium]